MSRLTPALILKSSLLLIVYGTLAVYFLLVSPRNVTSKENLREVTLHADSIYFMNAKNPNDCYVFGHLKGVEMRTIRMNRKDCRNILGVNDFLLRIRQPPSHYTLFIDDQVPTLFGKRHSIYEIRAEDAMLLTYEHSAEIYQEQKDLFFYLSIGFFAFIGLVLGRSVYVKMNEASLKRSI